MSSIVDRTRYPAPGLLGGKAGTAGELILDNGARPNPKSQIELEPGQAVRLNLPGGGGFGDPFERDPELVRADVIAGYVTPEAAARDYGVQVKFTGRDDELVRMPEQWAIDNVATAKLRRKH